MQINSFFSDVFLRYKLYIFATLLLLVGVFIGLLISSFQHKESPQDIRSSKSSYKFINPLLECQNVAFENYNNLDDLEKDIQDLLDQSITEGKITTASVYYRDLNNGPWFDINRDEMYSPASLVKVPVMIAIYKIAEADPTFLSKTITIESDLSYAEQNFIPEQLLVKGQTYTIQELMQRMIIDSDNNAYEILLSNIDQSVLIQVYNDFGIDIQKLSSEDPDGNIISVRDYPVFFRVLFNASYLNRKNSEEALSILARSSYVEGLVAGTPEETVVAHKYGERLYTFSGNRQLHDCGIVYNTKSPYLLCIMSKGRDFGQLELFLKTTTQMIDQQHSKNTE